MTSRVSFNFQIGFLAFLLAIFWGCVAFSASTYQKSAKIYVQCQFEKNNRPGELHDNFNNFELYRLKKDDRHNFYLYHPSSDCRIVIENAVNASITHLINLTAPPKRLDVYGYSFGIYFPHVDNSEIYLNEISKCIFDDSENGNKKISDICVKKIERDSLFRSVGISIANKKKDISVRHQKYDTGFVVFSSSIYFSTGEILKW